MDYLTLVQEAMRLAGTRTQSPTTLVSAVDIVADFKGWVQDSWRELQEESTNWWFRQKLDQTLALTKASGDSYSMPTGLETLNYRTVSIYTTAKTDEGPIYWIDYERWRMGKDTVDSATNRPQIITETPSGLIQVWPVPDKSYTLRFDGVWDIDTMSGNSDTPGSVRTGATSLNVRYHYLLVWDAVRRYAEHHQDAASLEKAQSKFLAQHARLKEKRTPPVYVKVGRLVGNVP